MVPALNRRFSGGLILAMTACAAPTPQHTTRVDLRACVAEQRLIGTYAKHFKAAVAVEPRGGRECDITVRVVSALNAGKVQLRSAYDGAVLAELDGPIDLIPQLAALSLAPDTDLYKRVAAQRAASGFHR